MLLSPEAAPTMGGMICWLAVVVLICGGILLAAYLVERKGK